MAGYSCDAEDGLPAAFLVTNLENGETVSPCLQHAGAIFLELAQALGAASTQEPAVQATAGAEGAREAEAAPDAAGRKRGRTGRQAASQALTSEASPFPDLAPDDS